TKAAKAVWIAVDSTGNLDSLISAYRAFPPLLGALNAVSESRTRLEDVVHAGRDLRLAQTVGVLVNEEQQQSSLTPREQEVLELLHKGMTNRQIARTLWISETTTKVHVRHIFRKLNVHSQTQAPVAEGDA